jgi:hypothetical protein
MIDESTKTLHERLYTIDYSLTKLDYLLYYFNEYVVTTTFKTDRALSGTIHLPTKRRYGHQGR